MSKGKHHGGAWKVAYADFVTTMMALFLVLWLTAQDAKIKQAIERAFRNPFSSVTKESVGIIPNKDVQATHESKGAFDSPSAMQLELLRRLSEDLSKLLQDNPEDQAVIKLDVTPDGLRINVFDRSRRPVFEVDSTQFTEYGSWVFSTMAWVISRYQSFQVELEGHTESGRKPASPSYGAWELTADRANTTRRELTARGVPESQIYRVAGFADTQPMHDLPATNEANRRVTVLLKLQSAITPPKNRTALP